MPCPYVILKCNRRANLEFQSHEASSSFMKTTCFTPPPYSFALVCDYHENYLGHTSTPRHINCTLVIVFPLGHQSISMQWRHARRAERSMKQVHAMFWRERFGSASVSPRSLWSRTWTSAFPGFSSWASSGPSGSAPGSPASTCALTDSAWRWPEGNVWQERHETSEERNRLQRSLYKCSSDAQKLKLSLWNKPQSTEHKNQFFRV